MKKKHQCALRLDRNQHFRIWITPVPNQSGYWTTVQRTCDGKTIVERIKWGKAVAETRAKEIMKELS